MLHPSLHSLIVLWLAWGTILLAFQTLVTHRLDVRRPDFAATWTAQLTDVDSLKEQRYLNEPWFNRQVSWDSEFYLAIAVGGYEDPDAAATADPETGQRLPISYNFFPVYPYLMRLLAVPLRTLSLNPIATASLAGVVISLLGTLVGVLALWEIARGSLGEEGAWRAAFYLLVFPTSFFLAMVYTEGLFAGLAFGSLALARRGHWLGASVLAAGAAGTRAVGVALVLPLAWTWFQAVKGQWRAALCPARLVQAALVVAPLVVFLIWRHSFLGQQFVRLTFVFGRGPLLIADTFANWQGTLVYAASTPQSTIYYGLELFTMGLALVAGWAMLPRYPAEALFSLAVWALAVSSGAALSMSRYMLVLPTTYLFLASLGCSPAFDRAWSLASILLLGMLAMLFAFDMWVG